MNRTYDITSITPWLTDTVTTTSNTTATSKESVDTTGSAKTNIPPSSERSTPQQPDYVRSPFQYAVPSVQMLIRTMLLPAPLVQVIASFLPLPTLWDKRIERLESWTCANNPNEAILYALDIIDEILEAAGWITALDVAKIVAPYPHPSWHEWKRSAISNTALELNREYSTLYRPSGDERWYILEPVPPPPSPTHDGNNSTLCALRRRMGYLPLLNICEFGSNIVSILMNEPYCIPIRILQRLIRMADVASLCRRSCIESNPSTVFGTEPHNHAVISHVVQFEPVVATDILDLTKRFYRWHYKRENKILTPTTQTTIE
jgi:hypothetical protein